MSTVQLLVVLSDLLCPLIVTILNAMLNGIYNEIFVTYINVTYVHTFLRQTSDLCFIFRNPYLTYHRTILT